MRPDPRELSRWIGRDLSEAQVAAAVAPLRPGLIVAGAGTGKTTVMAARVTWLVATGDVRPDEVLGLTFTTKAAGELTRRVRDAVATARAQRPVDEADVGDPTISTYHSFANSLVVEHGPLVGAEPASRVLPEAAVRQLAHRVLCRTLHDFEGDQRNLDELVKGITALDSALSEHDLDPDRLRADDGRLVETMLGYRQQAAGREIIDAALRRRDLAALVLELRAEKQRLMVVDFADQLRWAARVAQEHPGVGHALRSRYRVVLLDEYQDTSVTQRRLMQHLFGGGHAVTAVGDPLQAIYGFRGASVRNIERFPWHFPTVDGSPAPTFSLVENRRSRQRILDVANTISAPLREGPRGTTIPPLVAAREPQFPTAEVVCAFLDTEEQEHAWLAGQVVRLHGAGHPWSEITVLLRAMTGVGPLRDTLAAHGVPVEVVGVEGLIALPEVVEVISVMRLLHDPASNPDCARLLAGARWRVGPRDLALLGRRAAELAGGLERSRELGVDDTMARAVASTDPVDLVCLLDALDDLGGGPFSHEGRLRMAAFSAELRALRRHVGDPLGDLVQRVLDTTGLESELRAQPEEQGAPRLAALQAFLALAAEFRDLDGRSTLAGFLRFLADAKRFDASPDALVPSATDSVRIMTAHKSKGLEFPVVVLPSLVEGSFPTRRLMPMWTSVPTAIPFSLRDEDPPRELPLYPDGPAPTAKERTGFREAVRHLTDNEETRLAYVAVTRAETTLVASGARWALSGASTPREPSRYLEAVRAGCLDGGGTIDSWSVESDLDANPLAHRPTADWPVVDDPGRLELRRWAAHAVRSRVGSVLSLDDCSQAAADPDGIVAGWDADLAVLLEEAQREGRLERVVTLPTNLSTTDLMRLADDEEAFTLDLVRPMPRQPSPAARRGTRFHAWVETLWGQQPLLEPDDLPGAADAEIDSDDELDAIKATFAAMEYAAMTPTALEEPFTLVLAGRVVSGRIDAVFRHRHPSGDPDLDRWEVVDWKTSREATADPLQLATYRLAWAELQGVPLDRVDASFAYVRRGEVVRYGAGPGSAGELPDRAGIERLLISAAV